MLGLGVNARMEFGLRQKLGEQARKWVEDTLDIEGGLDRYAALYYELAGKSSGGNGWSQGRCRIETSTEVEKEDNTGTGWTAITQELQPRRSTEATLNNGKNHINPINSR